MLVKEYQLDPIDHKLLHADFYAIAMDKLLTRDRADRASRASPRASSSRAASSTSSAARSKSSVCRPTSREHIDVDITELMLHQGVRVRDLPTDGKWKAVERRRTC